MGVQPMARARPHARELQQVAQELAQPIERVFAEIHILATVTADVLTTALAAGGQATSADLAMLASVADGTIGRYSLLGGAGVVVNPGLLADVQAHLEWRQLGRDARPRSLVLDVDPNSADPYDYWEMEWFRVPRDEHRRMVGGPYFDYRGADRFGLTFAVPVDVNDEFVAIAGADVPLAQLEPELLPILHRLPRRAALINHENRVITSNSPHYAISARVRADSNSSLSAPVVPDLGWTLIVNPDR